MAEPAGGAPGRPPEPASKAARCQAYVNWPVLYEGMDALGLDALVACSAASTFYLSGCFDDDQYFVRAGAFVLVPREAPPTQVVPRAREAHARSTGWLEDIRAYAAPTTSVEALATVLAERGLERGRLGLETEFLPISAERKLARRLPGATLLDANSALARARWVKTPAETVRIQHAVVTSDQAVYAAWQRCQAGDTEREIQARMVEEMARRGADRFQMRVASGGGTHVSHHDASERRLERGDLVTSVFAAYWDHYWGDNERMGTVGPPSAQQRERYAVVYQALMGTVERIRPGVPVSELYEYPQAVFAQHGDTRRRPHMGHGMPRTRGHEDPMIQPTVTTPLEPGMVFMLEQSYRAAGERYTLSKLVQVTEQGHKVLDDWWDLREPFIFA